MALSEDRTPPDRPETSSEVARPGTAPLGSATSDQRDLRSVDPRELAGAAPAPEDRQPVQRSADAGLPAGGSRQETGLHGKPASGGGSNEHARLPDTRHRGS